MGLTLSSLTRINMDISKRVKLLWKISEIVAKMEPLESEIEAAHGNAEREAELAHRVGVLDRHQLKRIKMLWRFASLLPKAREIELEWQKIQQDDNDETFAFNMLRGQNESLHYYKKGIAEGIQWCLNRFS